MSALGYQTGHDPTYGDYNYTVTNFNVNPDYACTLFQSCAKTTFIAEAALQSSMAFLDFLVSFQAN